jgi:hypothetical protein
VKKLHTAALIFLLAGACAASRAHADDAHLIGLHNDAEITPPRPGNGYWSDAAPRFFLSTRSELGIPYLKPYFSAGYGTPHWIWVGVDLNAIATPEFLQSYFGVRAATPIVDLAFGARDTSSFSKTFLTPAAVLTRSDVLNTPGKAARYWAWEAEAVVTAPLPHSALAADFIAVRTLDVPAGRYVYDESYRAVVKEPLVLRTTHGRGRALGQRKHAKAGAIDRARVRHGTQRRRVARRTGSLAAADRPRRARRTPHTQRRGAR